MKHHPHTHRNFFKYGSLRTFNRLCAAMTTAPLTSLKHSKLYRHSNNNRSKLDQILFLLAFEFNSLELESKTKQYNERDSDVRRSGDSNLYMCHIFPRPNAQHVNNTRRTSQNVSKHSSEQIKRIIREKNGKRSFNPSKSTAIFHLHSIDTKKIYKNTSTLRFNP